jgi:hypothetical protein
MGILARRPMGDPPARAASVSTLPVVRAVTMGIPSVRAVSAPDPSCVIRPMTLCASVKSRATRAGSSRGRLTARWGNMP